MKATCPNNSEHKRFITTVHEQHDWVVDEDGEFKEDLGCTASGKPDPDNLWKCAECGAEAVVK